MKKFALYYWTDWAEVNKPERLQYTIIEAKSLKKVTDLIKNFTFPDNYIFDSSPQEVRY